MYMYIYIYIYIYICICIYMYTYTYTHIHMYIYTYVHMNICLVRRERCLQCSPERASFMMLARRDGSDGTGSVEAIDLVQEVLPLSRFAPSSEGWFRTLCCKKLNWFEREGPFERGLVRDGLDDTGQVEAIDLVQEVPPSLLRQVTSQNFRPVCVYFVSRILRFLVRLIGFCINQL